MILYCSWNGFTYRFHLPLAPTGCRLHPFCDETRPVASGFFDRRKNPRPTAIVFFCSGTDNVGFGRVKKSGGNTKQTRGELRFCGTQTFADIMRWHVYLGEPWRRIKMAHKLVFAIGCMPDWLEKNHSSRLIDPSVPFFVSSFFYLNPGPRAFPRSSSVLLNENSWGQRSQFLSRAFSLCSWTADRISGTRRSATTAAVTAKEKMKTRKSPPRIIGYLDSAPSLYGDYRPKPSQSVESARICFFFTHTCWNPHIDQEIGLINILWNSSSGCS